MNKVEVQCAGNMSLELDDMNAFQGDLKHLPEENYQALKLDILELGISSSFDVWRNPEDLKWYLLNGHQRKTALTRMRDKESFQVPSLPCTVVHARDFREAKKKVLALTSQFGVMTKKGLHTFMVDNEFTMEDITPFTVLSDIDIIEFGDEFFPPSTSVSEHEHDLPADLREEDKDTTKEGEETYLTNSIKQIILFYKQEDFQGIIDRANKLIKELEVEDFSDLFLKLLELHENS